jgi:von Willebrand factor type A domain
MSGRVPTWLADWIGVSTASAQNSAMWQLDSAWQWAPWATVLLVIGLVAWTVWLYARESAAAGRRYRALLVALRLFAIAVVLVMIAQWALALRLTAPPIVAIVLDRSASMDTADGYTDAQSVGKIKQRLANNELSAATRIDLVKLLLTQADGNFIKELSARHRLEVYFVDGAIERMPTSTEAAQLTQTLHGLSTTGPNRDATRLGDAVRQVLHDFRGAPPAAIVLMTDGITTDGLPLAAAAEEARRAGVRLMTVGVGRATPLQDIELADVIVDDMVFVNDVVSFQIQVRASGLEDRPAKITLRRLGAADSAGDSSKVAEQSIELPPNGEALTTRLVDRPRKPGDFVYEVEVQPHDDETNQDNNRERRAVTVRDEKIRVLLVQAYPSYEFRFLKSLLERDNTIELSTYLQDADPAFAEQDKTALRSFPLSREELFEYDVLLAGDVDPRLLPRSAWQNVRAFVAEKGGGAAFLAGPRFFPSLYADNSDVAALLPFEGLAPAASSDDQLPNSIKSGFTVSPTPIGLQNPAMQLGDTPPDTEQIWQQLAPLYWLYEVEKPKPAAQVLAIESSARASSAPSPALRPIILFQYVGPGRVLFHAVDSTWRWRLGAGEAYFARYWVQTIRFLARGKLASGRGAQLVADRREYRQGDAVRLRARFLDPQLAPANEAVTVLIDSPGQARRRIALQRNLAAAGIFEGLLVDLAEGEYEAIMVQPQLTGNPPATRFAVVAAPGELSRLEMDAAALAAAAETTGGKFYRLVNADRLPAELPAGRRTPLESLPPVPLWNRWWLLAMFLACITSEWILRKRKGML